MECPVCKVPMAILEYDQVEVDFCVECQGVWLDEGEIELLFGDAEACAKILNLGSPCDSQGEAARLCPACDAEMTKEATTSDTEIVFDACPHKHGLWFDAGELQAVLKDGAALDDSGAIEKFLQGLFGESVDGSSEKRLCD